MVELDSELILRHRALLQSKVDTYYSYRWIYVLTMYLKLPSEAPA